MWITKSLLVCAPVLLFLPPPQKKGEKKRNVFRDSFSFFFLLLLPVKDGTSRDAESHQVAFPRFGKREGDLAGPPLILSLSILGFCCCCHCRHSPLYTHTQIMYIRVKKIAEGAGADASDEERTPPRKALIESCIDFASPSSHRQSPAGITRPRPNSVRKQTGNKKRRDSL